MRFSIYLRELPLLGLSDSVVEYRSRAKWLLLSNDPTQVLDEASTIIEALEKADGRKLEKPLLVEVQRLRESPAAHQG